MKVLVLGVRGMAGHMIALSMLESGHEVEGYARTPISYCKTIVGDACNTKQLQSVLFEGQYDVVVNCVGRLNTAVDAMPTEGIFLNSVLPHFLAQCTSGTKTRVVQISTDCVFSGKRGNYAENAFQDADSLYGRSKALGELKNGKDLTIRTSIVGPDLREEGIGLFNWFMRQEGCVQGYSQVFWTGITTLELSKAIPQMLEQGVTGLIHLVNGEKISKYQLLQLFNQIRESTVPIRASNELEVDKSLCCTRTDYVYHVPSYESMVSEMASWILTHADLYPHYHV